MIIILFFSLGCPKKIRRYLKAKFPEWKCLWEDGEYHDENPNGAGAASAQRPAVEVVVQQVPQPPI